MCMSTCMYVFMCPYTSKCLYVYVYVFVCVCLQVQVCMYVCYNMKTGVQQYNYVIKLIRLMQLHNVCVLRISTMSKK